jgi:hypothetical protein
MKDTVFIRLIVVEMSNCNKDGVELYRGNRVSTKSLPSWLLLSVPGGIKVEHLTLNPEIESSNPVTETEREKKLGKSHNNY